MRKKQCSITVAPNRVQLRDLYFGAPARQHLALQRRVSFDRPNITTRKAMEHHVIDHNDDSFPLDLERLLPAAVAQILAHEDPRQFQQWLYQHLDSFITPGAREQMDAGGWRSLATMFGTAMWNATPLPGNRFAPKPLPRPGRNDPCPCDSGRKFKHCCNDAPALGPLAPPMMWSYVLDGLSGDDFALALEHNQIPTEVLAMHANELIEQGQPVRAMKVLEPLFEGDLTRRNSKEDDFALDQLLDAYDELGHVNKKLSLLARITRDAKRSPLRAGAWQRLASIRMDDGDSPGAWEAFETAQRDQPNAPALAHLEILLLANDGRIAEVPTRARMWIRRLQRQKHEGIEGVLEWLEDAAEDPHGTLAELGIHGSGDEGQLLRHWLIGVRERAICSYAIADAESGTPPEAATGGQLESSLQGMGIAADQIEEILGDPFAQDHVENIDSALESAGDMGEAESLTVTVPAELRELERQWHDIFPCVKPFSTQDESFDQIDPWDEEEDWATFLDEHPQAWDSVDILDDLATALMIHPMIGERAFTEQMLMPILDRAVSIIEQTLAQEKAPRLAWVVAENRPMLRTCARLAMWNFRLGDIERGVALCERLCTLNPHDNHGLRCVLIEEYLRAGRDHDAVELAARYANDTFAETRFGNVLALYRLQRIEAAHEALSHAAEDLPEVLRYLLPKRIRQPKTDDGPGMSMGSEEQAWFYRVAFREEWERTPGALAWLKKASRGLK